MQIPILEVLPMQVIFVSRLGKDFCQHAGSISDKPEIKAWCAFKAAQAYH